MSRRQIVDSYSRRGAKIIENPCARTQIWSTHELKYIIKSISGWAVGGVYLRRGSVFRMVSHTKAGVVEESRGGDSRGRPGIPVSRQQIVDSHSRRGAKIIANPCTRTQMWPTHELDAGGYSRGRPGIPVSRQQVVDSYSRRGAKIIENPCARAQIWSSHELKYIIKSISG